MATLKTYLTGSLSYDQSWGVWAEKIDRKFDLEESDARFGQFAFENGSLLDDYELVGNNEFLTDSRDNYCGTDENCEDFYEEWAIDFLQSLNEQQD